MIGAELAVAALRCEGVANVFGLPGTTIMHLIDAIAQRDDVRWLSVRHEQVAAFMADGYARATGEPGVCMASRGPGAANLAIGIHNAYAESVPVVAVIGQVADGIYYRDAFEEMDLVRFFEPITKWSVEVHETGRIPELMQRAVRTATSGRPGPVMISLPLDVQLASTDAVCRPSFRLPGPAPRADEVERAVELLTQAARPVIVVGGGLRGSGYDAALTALAERLDIPVVTTWLRKNAFPNDSGMFCGSLGYGAVAATDELVADADVVLAIGCRFSEFTTKRWTLLPATAALIHVDIDPDVIGRYYVPAVGICADAALAVTALLAAVDAAAPPDRVPDPSGRRAGRARAYRAAYLSQTKPFDRTAIPGSGRPVSSAALVGALREVLGQRSAILVQDAPSLGTWIHRHVDFTSPGTFYGSAGGAMGWGLPAAMGMQLARPDAAIVAVCGDGSFWMVAQDLETAVREKLPVVTVINNNFAFGNTRDRQAVAHGGRYLGVFYRNPDFAEFARLLGAHGERVEKDTELLPALNRALERARSSGLPAVVDVVQDIHEGLPPDLVPPAAR
jgi:acetolactate synthase I/II/III large subunit